MIVERHEVAVAAPPERALAAARAVTTAETPVLRLLFRLRGIPVRETVEESLRALGFRTVAESPHELRLRLERGRLRAELRLFAGAGALATETEVEADGRRAALAFRAYWLVVGPFSGLVRRDWLRAAGRRAGAE